MNLLPNPTTINISIFVFMIVLLSLLVVLLLGIYWFLSKWLKFLQKDYISGAEKIVDEAREKALQIVSQATTKANSSLDAIENLSEESKSMLKSELDTLVKEETDKLRVASKELVDFYKTSLTKQHQESFQEIEQATQEVEQQIEKEMDEFKDVLHEGTVGMQEKVEAKATAEYQKVEKELESYKARRLKAVDETIYDILHDVSKDVFGQALSMEEHQELVLKALEEAKQNNIFSE